MDYLDNPYHFPIHEKYLKPGWYGCPPSWAGTIQVHEDQRITFQSCGRNTEGCPMCGAAYVFTCYCGMLEVL